MKDQKQINILIYFNLKVKFCKMIYLVLNLNKQNLKIEHENCYNSIFILSYIENH